MPAVDPQCFDHLCFDCVIRARIKNMAKHATSDIDVTIRLSRDAQAKLAARAVLAGKPLGEYIASVVESVVESPRTLAQISGPVYQRFLDSGTTDEQLSEELEQAKHEMRTERRRRLPS